MLSGQNWTCFNKTFFPTIPKTLIIKLLPDLYTDDKKDLRIFFSRNCHPKLNSNFGKTYPIFEGCESKDFKRYKKSF